MGRFATTIFSATLRCNVFRNHVVTIQNNDATMLLRCVALKIVSCNTLTSISESMCAILSNRLEIFAEKYAVALNGKLSLKISLPHYLFWKYNLNLNIIWSQSKRTKKTSKKIFKKDEEEEHRRRKPAVKTKDKSQGCSVTFLPTNVSLHAPV